MIGQDTDHDDDNDSGKWGGFWGLIMWIICGDDLDAIDTEPNFYYATIALWLAGCMVWYMTDSLDMTDRSGLQSSSIGNILALALAMIWSIVGGVGYRARSVGALCTVHYGTLGTQEV